MGVLFLQKNHSEFSTGAAVFNHSCLIFRSEDALVGMGNSIQKDYSEPIELTAEKRTMGPKKAEVWWNTDDD